MARAWAFLKVFFRVSDDPMNGEGMQRPDRKVGMGAGAIGIPAGVVIAWALTEFAGVNVDEPVAAAFGGLVSAIVAYMVPAR